MGDIYRSTNVGMKMPPPGPISKKRKSFKKSKCLQDTTALAQAASSHACQLSFVCGLVQKFNEISALHINRVARKVQRQLN